MGFLKSLFGNKSKYNAENLEHAVCPNCWGKQEYAERTREKKIENKDKKAFIAEFSEKHVTGIKSEKSNIKYCPKCQSKFAAEEA